jgi:hypothetical protein
VTDTPTEREADSTWTRLRRRKVVQWGVAYAAGAWLLMQVVEYFSGTFDWPRQVQQLSTLVLLIGLPIVVVIAYYHGDRGQQRITTPEFAILTVLLLLGGGAFWYYQRTDEAGKDAVPTASAVLPDASPGVKDARPSVAVLPFENRSREADDAFFVDGIHDDILTQVSKVSALRGDLAHLRRAISRHYAADEDDRRSTRRDQDPRRRRATRRRACTNQRAAHRRW